MRRNKLLVCLSARETNRTVDCGMLKLKVGMLSKIDAQFDFYETKTSTIITHVLLSLSCFTSTNKTYKIEVIVSIIFRTNFKSI